MGGKLRKEWHALVAGHPGHRFREHYARLRRDGPRGRSWWRVVLAASLLVAGFVLLFIPGPGIPLIVVGAGMLAQESRRVARLLDRLELAARRFLRRLRSSSPS